MPTKIQSKINENNDLKQVACDYIAGMTDRFAIDEYAKLFDPHIRV